MGIWGAGSFSNDDALDFLACIDDPETVLTTLTMLEKTTDRFSSQDASIALACCEILAAMLGRPPVDMPDDCPALTRKSATTPSLDTATALVNRLRKTSELADLWAEEDDSEWQLALDGLLARLDPDLPYDAPKRNARQKVPDNFLGHCYICYGPVTKRDGIHFEYTFEDGGTCAIHPHRKCIEQKTTGPHWNKDGSPTANSDQILLAGIGVDVS